MKLSTKKFISELCSFTCLASIYWRLFKLDDPKAEEIKSLRKPHHVHPSIVKLKVKVRG